MIYILYVNTSQLTPCVPAVKDRLSDNGVKILLVPNSIAIASGHNGFSACSLIPPSGDSVSINMSLLARQRIMHA